jgi:hypothetical protein
MTTRMEEQTREKGVSRRAEAPGRPRPAAVAARVTVERRVEEGRRATVERRVVEAAAMPAPLRAVRATEANLVRATEAPGRRVRADSEAKVATTAAPRARTRREVGRAPEISA